jgi:hypothetical protein
MVPIESAVRLAVELIDSEFTLQKKIPNKSKM